MVTLLTVCTGNICRSPYAHLLLGNRLDEIAPGAFSVASAGTMGLTGKPMDERSAARLAATGVRERAYTVDSFSARRLGDADVAGADVVLALTQEHRDAVIQMSPRMLKRAYTVREFARLVAHVYREAGDSIPGGAGPEQVAARWKALIKYATLYRSGLSAPAADDDVVDPYRREDAVYDEMVDQLLPALEAIIDLERAAAARA
ncbi:arsenate reductase/protein-tyrosine-phosphatase family protein [Zhihengliuella salsuginis]|uniref:protein-tyrosine-phosphatase n=1 Tax=Zhihengliuella salsuginis TaxID=578222 RepID=A0ABQ3GKM9_9MICC|nr:low molecular weight phosphatase family protein [Zhihengliuella salsuginis]GHD09802.1 low molecular weight phosphatase family protein [Zhihengliuella salsuginis]